jgi:hypothetical protein
VRFFTGAGGGVAGWAAAGLASSAAWRDATAMAIAARWGILMRMG